MDEPVKGILVVDDEADFRRVFCDSLRDRQYAIFEAEDGVQALEVYEENKIEIDLVITDFRMPRMGGERLIQEIRKRQDYLPIIGITGHQDLSDKLKVISEGGFYFLEKPLPRWEFIERIVETAIRLFRDEKRAREVRDRDLRISRLLRSYILKNPIESAGTEIRFPHGLHLQVEVRSADVLRPGGDLVEWFRPTPSELVFYVADATGHDLVACFIACMNSMVLHRSHHGQRPSLQRLVEGIDRAVQHLCGAGSLDPSRHGLTLFLGSINLEFGELTYVNAGHPDAFLMRPGRGTTRLDSTFRAIGWPFPFQVSVGREYFRPGDLLFLYTDGVFDVLADGDPGPGMRRLESLVAPLAHESAAVIAEAIEAALLDHLARSGQTTFTDDTTLVAIKAVGTT